MKLPPKAISIFCHLSTATIVTCTAIPLHAQSLSNFNNENMHTCVDEFIIKNTWLPQTDIASITCQNTNTEAPYTLDQLTQLSLLDHRNNTQLIDIDSITQLTGLTALHLSGNSDLNIDDVITLIEQNPNLTELSLRGIHIDDTYALFQALFNNETQSYYDLTILDLSNTGLTDIDELINFPNLTSLNLSDNNIEFAVGFEQLTQLTQLDLSNNKLIDTGLIFELSALTQFDVSGNSLIDINQVTGIIQNNAKLTELGVGDIAIEDSNTFFESLRSHETNEYLALTSLNVSNTGLTESYPLNNFPQLTHVNISDNSLIELAGFEELTQLQQLNANNTQLIDIYPISHLTGLTALHLSGNADLYITDVIALIEQNPGLTELSLGDIQIDDTYAFFQALFNDETQSYYDLTILDLSNTGLDNIDDVHNFLNLTSLNVSNNNIEFIHSIELLTQLTELNINNNPIIDIHTLLSVTGLTQLSLSGNTDILIDDVLQVIHNNPGITKIEIADITVTDYVHFFESLRNSETNEYLDLTVLDLSNTGLTDIDELINFPNLTSLNLSDNNIEFPVGFEQLTQLTQLDLSNNKLIDTGLIFELSALTQFDVSGNSLIDINQVTGIIQNNAKLTELGVGDIAIEDSNTFFESLRSHETNEYLALTSLNVSNTGLTESYPLNNFPQLTHVNISDNSLIELAGFEELTQLQQLNANNTQLIDIYPISHLTGLTALHLSGNADLYITDVIALIEQNPGLTELSLGDIQIDDTYAFFQALFNDETQSYYDLTILDLSNTGLDNIDDVHNFLNLTSLNVSNNNIEFIHSIELLTQLTELNINNNPIIDIHTLLSVTGLTQLSLSGNTDILIDDVLQVIHNNPGITKIEIADITVTDYVHFFESLRNSETNEYLDLTVLDLSNTGLTDIDELINFPNLTSLNLSDNNIEFAVGFEQLTQLTQLDLSNNKLIDTGLIFELSALTQFDISGNSLIDINQVTGIIQNNAKLTELGVGDIAIEDSNTFFESLRNHETNEYLALTSLNVSNTGLTDIDELINFPNLTSLNLSDNNIEFPVGFEQLTQLTQLDLSNNKLIDTGLIFELSALTQFDISGNSLIDINQVTGIIQNNAKLTELGVGDIAIEDSNTFFESLRSHETNEYLALTSLNVSNTGLTESYPLNNFPQLTHVNISDNSLIELAGFEELTQLQQLNANNTQLIDIYPISHLTGLTALHLSGNADLYITDVIALIEQNPGLTELSLGDIQIDDTYAFFQALFNDETQSYYDLTILDLSNTGLDNIDEVHNFLNLTSLNVSNNNIEFIHSIELLTQLTELNINNNPIIDIHTLLSVTGLTQLSLSGNTDILIDDVLQVIHNNPGITKIEIADITVTDYVHFFESLRNSETNEYLDLTVLDLSNTGLTDIDELINFPNLTSLNLSDNNIEFAVGFEQLTQLTQLDLSNNKLIDTGLIFELSALTQFDISGNSLIDINQVTGIIQNNAKLTELGVGDIAIEDSNTFFESLRSHETNEYLALTSLNVSNTGLTDIDELINFPNLTSLNLSDNNIEFPVGFEQLTQLTQLDLSNNKLIDTGLIFELSALTQFDISGNSLIDINQVTGIIQNNAKLTELGVGDIAIEDSNTFFESLRSHETNEYLALTSLNVSNTGLTESYPLNNFPQLTHVNISDNSLIELAGFEELTQLQQLNANNTQLIDIYPISHLTGLTALHLSGNADLYITDVIALIEQNPGLTELSLGDIQIDDTYAFFQALFNDETQSYYDLTILDLSNTGLDNIDDVHNFLNLTSLNVSNNNIEFIHSIELLTQLTELNINNNPIIDIHTLLSVTGLTQLSLSGNTDILIDDVLQVIHNNPGITKIEIADITVTDYVHFFESLRNSETNEYLDLTVLDLSNTGLTDIDELINFPNLTSLNLSDNNIEFAVGFEQLTQLTQLDLSNNKLIDTGLIFELSALTQFDISGNSLIDINQVTGIIQNNAKLTELGVGDIAIEDSNTFFESLRSHETNEYLALTSLNVSNTGLTDIDELINFPNLTSLNLSDNNIEFPVGFEQLTQLTQLDLSNNKLIDTGLIFELSALTQFDISGNSLIDINQVTGIIQNNAKLTELGVGDIAIEDSNTFFESLRSHETNEYLALTSLNVSNTGLTESYPLNNFPQLTHVNISDNSLIELAGFEELTQLQQLNANNTQLIDIYPISHLTGLTALHLSGNADLYITDVIALIEQNPGLTELSLGDIQIDDTYAFFQALFNDETQSYYDLTILDLSNTGLDNIDDVHNFLNLTSLNVSNNNIEFIHSIELLTQLTELNINNNPIIDIHTLLSVTGLTQLSLSGNTDILIDDVLQVIHNNPGITKIEIADITVTDYVHFFESLRNSETNEYLDLTVLDLSNTGLTDIDELINFPNLTSLNLSDNNIEFAVGFEQLTQLTQLDLSNNKLIDTGLIFELSALTQFDISGNSLIDINQVTGIIQNNAKLTELGVGDIAIEDSNTFFESLRSHETNEYLALTSLNVSNTGLTESYPLNNFPQLTHVNISDNSLIELAGFEELTQLQQLNANNTQLIDIYPISHLTGLTALHLSGNADLYITDVIALIEQNPGLTELSLGDIQIDDTYAFFQALFNDETQSYYDLTILDLSNTGLDNIDEVYNFSSLLAINLFGNSELFCTDIDLFLEFSPSIQVTQPINC